ncbi:hypothetical protein G5S_0891 [Chlamydia pecorum E58]|uniref:Uncharacterized protein n=1 Tax=Chlamydia pecorum (strain ATCC VR-628 / DSM 29919 / E58) TaxID=331635 RepID=A0AA34WI74_CHLPE|nr:hypothetical protein G5S_0891 [Chlamydia pecorum E58]
MENRDTIAEEILPRLGIKYFKAMQNSNFIFQLTNLT